MKHSLKGTSKNRKYGIMEGWKDAITSNLPTFHSSIWFCNQIIRGVFTLLYEKSTNGLKKISISILVFLFLMTTASHAQSYCAASGSACNNTITNVTITSTEGGFNNTTGCETGGYGNYTSMVGSLVVNTNYQGSVTVNNSEGYLCAEINIWVDWNNNFLFTDAGENIFAAATWQVSVPIPFSIIPPSGTAAGFKRMRLRTNSACGAVSPCGVLSNSEVEDYTINVLSCTPAPATPGSITGSNSVCPGSVTPYSIGAVTGATTYTWTVPSGATISGQGTTSITVTFGSSSGNISVTASNSCGTSAPRTLSVTVSSPTVTATGAGTVCAGEGQQLNASGASTYSWSPTTGLNAPNISNPVATPAATTTYTVTGTTTNGCTKTATVTVTVNPLPPVPTITASGPTTFCQGDSVQLTSGSMTNNLWSTGSTDQSIYAASSGSYSVTVTDANGCTNSDSVMITVYPFPVVSLGADTMICDNSQLLLNAGSFASYFWQNGSTDSTYLVDPSGSGTFTFYVTVTNAGGCTGTDSITVEVDNCTGIAQLSGDLNIIISPNPSNREFTIISEKLIIENMEIHNVMGEKVYSEKILTPIAIGAKSLILNLDLTKGMYFLKMDADSGSIMRKIVISK